MKLIAAVVATLIAGLLALPLVVGGTTPAPEPGCGDVAVILATIRTVESGGNYQAKAAGSTASGAYQMIDPTWVYWSAVAGYQDRYANAWQAPPSVQDAAAAIDVRSILNLYHDASYVPLVWYFPAAVGDPTLMDIVPAPEAGNLLTPRQYQARWLDVYRTKLRAGSAECASTVDTSHVLPTTAQTVGQGPAAFSAGHHG